MPWAWCAGGIAVYLLTPAAPSSPLGAWPLSPAGAAALALAVSACAVAWRWREPLRGGASRWVIVLIALAAARVLVAMLSPEPGWLARYYANESWSGAPEWSSEYRGAGATRIDRELAFTGSEFPTHYLNGARYGEGAQREVSEPMSVEWRGAFALDAPADIAIDLRASGTASLTIDGAAAGATSGELAAGRHEVTVRYAKPAGTEGALHLSMHSPDGSPVPLFTPGSALRGHRAVAAVALGLDGVVAALLLVVVLQVSMAAWRADRAEALVQATALGALGVQGFLAALPLAGRFQTLTGGDDWLGFESRARDILEHGPLMTLGQPLGQGAAYFYHPFYPYFLAAVHAVSGESLFGPIFVQFLVLGATALLMWRFARTGFGTGPALCAVAALLVVFEIDFIRYYTITLLSENLYILTVTLCLTSFAAWARTGRISALVLAGAWAGLSSATRPAMMMFLFPAIAVAGVIAWRRSGAGAAVRAAALTGASWMLVVLPFTIRNWVVARKLVLISDGLGGTFIVHNVPAPIDAAPYMASFQGGIFNGLAVLWRVAVEHPSAVAALQVKKLGFTLGMIHWFDGYRPHPELVAISALYLAMLVVSPALRRAEFWPMHAFVAAHVASMFLTSPWNYGYRLILPPYIYTTTLSVAAAAAMIASARARRIRPS